MIVILRLSTYPVPTRRMARVLTNKSVNRDAFIEVFTTLWCGEQGVSSIKEIGECRFVAWFTSLRDKKRVLDMELWTLVTLWSSWLM
ncbi:hypothetical protein GBA52_024264 [Prunus armeniaca]|nr:hypothetical protein GBA52_024264 [Prunus armeniaca]